jgi:hypothetical protein
VWSLDQRSKRYGCQPSAMMGIRHPVLGYWFDEAVGWFGQWVDARLSERDEKGKPLYHLEKLLGVPPAPYVRGGKS